MPLTSPQSRPNHGFTLVELLVVISIIALLAALAFPVVAKMRDKADSLSSINSMRQLGACMATTATENNSSLPLSWASGKGNWYGRLADKNPTSEFPSSINMDAWKVAFDNVIASKKENYKPGNSATYPRIYGAPYGMNSNLSSISTELGEWKLVNLPRTPDMVVLGDGTINGTLSGAGLVYSKTGGSESISFRHPGKKAALLFADWHVATVTRAEVDANKGYWFDPTKK